MIRTQPIRRDTRAIALAQCEFVDTLERRILMATPAAPRASTFLTFDKGERQALIERLDNLPTQSVLRDKIGNGSSARLRDFDNSLLDYMLHRGNVDYYFATGSQSSYGSFITNNLSYSKVTEKANKIVDNRLFPPSTNSSDYTTTVSGAINYRAPNGALGDTFALTMNRFEYWGSLADGAWLSGNQSKYVGEISYELAQWSTQFDGSIDVPSDWSDSGKSGWQLVTAIRSEAWVQAYFKLLSVDNTSWSREDNTLMLYKLMQHGDYLYAQSQTTKADESVDSNKSIALAKALCYLGRLFPEFDTAAAWEAKGRELLFQSMSAQIYADGSHREQTPGYSIGVAEDLLDVYLLDKINGDASAWAGDPLATLNNIIESNRQFLSPDGRRPGTGDTYRTLSVSLFLKAGVILDKIDPTSTTLSGSYSTGATTIALADASNVSIGDVLIGAGKSEMIRVSGKASNTLTVERGVSGTTEQTLTSGAVIYNLGDQPFAKPSIGDVWLLGTTVTLPFTNVPATPSGVLGPRGKSYAMTDSGNYILRSDDSGDATQITFDAGPKGGFHGHNDLLNFELWSGGHPLIIDPGPYKYDGGADRDYVISTRAHNTVNVDGKNTGWIEGQNQPAIIASHSFQSSYATLEGTHFAYGYLDGQPVITRSIWYNYGDTMLIVDWGEAAASHMFQQSFNVPGSTEANVAGASGGSEFKTRYSDGSDNVRVKVINGGSLVKGGQTFVTGDSDTGYKLPAYRYTISKTDDFAVFVTLVNIYTGTTVPNVDAQVITSNPQPGQAIQVNLIRNGSVEQTLSFDQPQITRPSANLNLNALVSDTKYDSTGNLHLAYQDLDDKFLKYTVKNATTGLWSPVQIVDNSAAGVGAQIDLELDNNGAPAIAYYDDANQDLKYAIRSTENNAWRTQTVDSKYTVGQNPSLAFSRKNSALISYYLRSKGDIKVAAQQNTSTWSISTIDSTGDVGRFSKIMLDPNRTDLNARYVLAYEDRTNNGVRYGYTAGSWRTDLVQPAGITMTGGFVSMAFEDSGSGASSGVGADRYQPRITFYERYPDASLWFVKRDKTTGAWSTQRVDGSGSSKKMGAYSQISYESGKGEIFYFDDKNNVLRRAVNTSGSSWSYYTVGAGGREVRVSRHDNAWAVIGYDTDPDKLTLTIV